MSDNWIAPRWWARISAWLGGYFWLPCRLCGRYSGGHELKDRNGLSSSIWEERTGPVRLGHGICPWCTLAGKGTSPWE